MVLFTSCLKLSTFVACIYSPPSHSELWYFIKTSFSRKPLSFANSFIWPGTFSAIVSLSFYFTPFDLWNLSSLSPIWEVFPHCSGKLASFSPTAACTQASISAHITLCFLTPSVPGKVTASLTHPGASTVSLLPSLWWVSMAWSLK